MSKAKKPSKRSRPKGEVASDVFASPEELQQTLHELVVMGLVKRVVDHDSGAVLTVAVPDGLFAPLQVDAPEQAAEDQSLLHQQTMPPRLEKLLRSDAYAMWEAFARFRLAPFIESLTGPPAGVFYKQHDESIRSVVVRFVEDVMLAGFEFALQRYASQLKKVPELAEWRRAQKTGGDKGRLTLTERKEQNAQRIRDKFAAMERAGEPCTYQDVADALKAEGVEKCSRTTVERAINRRTVKRKKR